SRPAPSGGGGSGGGGGRGRGGARRDPRARPRRRSQTRAATSSLLLQRGRLVGRHVPHHDVVVRLGDARVAGVVVHVDVIDLFLGGGQIVEGLVRGDVLDGNHVHRADEMAVLVVREKRPRRPCLGIDIERAEPRDEVRQRDQRAHLL